MNNDKYHSFPFNPTSRKVLIFSLVLVFMSILQLVYRFNLPTDGWMVLISDNFENSDWVLWENLAGLSSGLQREDVILSVGGHSVEGLAAKDWISRPSHWEKGQYIETVVIRDGEQISFFIPVTNWTVAAVLQNFLVQPEILIGVISSIFLFLLGLYTFYQRSNLPAARVLLVLCSAYLALTVSGILPDGLSVQFDPIAFCSTAFFSYLIFPVFLAPSLLSFTLVFPNPKAIIIQKPYLILLPYILGIIVGIILLVPGSPNVLGWMTTMGMIFASVVSLIHSGFILRDEVSQTQFRVVILGMMIGLLLMLFVFPAAAAWVSSPFLSQLFGAGFYFGFSLIAGTLAVAILRFRLFEIDLIIHKALVYTILSALSVGIYILIVGYLGFIFRVESNQMLSIIATGVVAVLFAPLREKVRQTVSRLIFGQRDDPYHVLTHLGQQLESALEPSLALSLTVESIAKSLKVPYVTITLLRSNAAHMVVEYGIAQRETSDFPLVYAGKNIGNLAVSARSKNDPLTSPDIRLLRDLAQQIGATAHAVLLGFDLEKARLRLVQERGEARRQLGRDVHDDLGHRLVALTRKVERKKSFSEKNVHDQQQLLSEIHDELIQVTKKVRDIAYQLYPPELELLGLVSALEERAQSFPEIDITIESSQEIQSFLSSTTEAALYYIALEAITNIKKHSQAKTCRIHFTVLGSLDVSKNKTLEMAIVDDGHGFHAENLMGMGLLSMQARAVEVGGVCQIDSNFENGTRILVRIPTSNQLE